MNSWKGIKRAWTAEQVLKRKREGDKKAESSRIKDLKSGKWNWWRRNGEEEWRIDNKG